MKIPSLRHLFPAPVDDKKKEDSDKVGEEDSDKEKKGDIGTDTVWWMDKLNVIELNDQMLWLINR